MLRFVLPEAGRKIRANNPLHRIAACLRIGINVKGLGLGDKR